MLAISTALRPRSRRPVAGLGSMVLALMRAANWAAADTSAKRRTPTQCRPELASFPSREVVCLHTAKVRMPDLSDLRFAWLR